MKTCANNESIEVSYRPVNSRRTHSSGSAIKEGKGVTRINRTKSLIEKTSADIEARYSCAKSVPKKTCANNESIEVSYRPINSRRTHSSGGASKEEKGITRIPKEEKGGTCINRTKSLIEETCTDNESIEGTTDSPSSSSRWKRWQRNKSEKEKQPFIAKPSRMVQRSSLGIIEGDGDVWIEVPFRSRKTVLNSIFISVDSGKWRREPPTGASRIIYMPV